MRYSIYYQALVERKKTWLLTAVLRSCEGLVFDRTQDTGTNTFEFLVSPDQEAAFLALMQYFIDQQIVHNLLKMQNPYQQKS